jgi:hypothetical protein
MLLTYSNKRSRGTHGHLIRDAGSYSGHPSYKSISIDWN